MKSAITGICILLAATNSDAACLQGHPSTQGEFRTARYVLQGFVKSGAVDPLDKDGFITGEHYTVDSLNVFKGRIRKSIVIYNPNDSGRFPLDIGSSYILFVSRDWKGRNVIDSCGNSVRLDNTQEPLLTELTALAKIGN